MGVEDVVAIYSCLISLNSFLCYCVSNFLTICIFRQICKAVSPVSILIWCYFLRFNFCSIRKKIYCDCIRANAVLIITIVPALGSTNLSCFCLMSICDIVIIYAGGVPLYQIFTYSINDFFTILIFVEIVECVFPVICCSYFPRFNFYSVCKEVDCDAVWADAVLVVTVVPSLDTFDFSLSCNRINQVVSVYCFVVSFYILFINAVRVCGLSICTVQRQIFPLILPAISFGYCLSIILFAILVQNNCDAFRQFSSFRCFPGLDTTNFCRSGDRVDQVISVYCFVVSSYILFIDTVSICGLSICTVQRQIFPLILPAISFGYCLSIILFAILVQNNCDAFRQFSSFRCFPGLSSTYFRLSGDRIDQIISCHTLGITFYICFVNAVSVRGLSIRAVCRQIFPLILPTVSCCHRLGVILFAILVQDDCDTLWQDRSFWYVPGLASADINLVTLCVRDIESIYCLVVSGYGFLIYTVSILVSICVILIKICETVIPVIGCGHCLGIIHFTVLFQDDCDAFR